MIPLVLVPGTLCDGRVFEPMMAHLRDVAEPIVARTGDHASLPRMAEAILACAPTRFAVAGFSLGGMVALQMMLRAAGRVTGLALICTRASASTMAQARARRKWQAAARAGGLSATVARSMPDWLHVRSARTGRVVVDMARREGLAVLARQTRALDRRPDARDMLAAVAVPTLVLCAAADRRCPPAEARAMAAAIPSAAFVEVPDAGHFAPLERPEAVAAALRVWLARIAA